uniref:Pentraxin family member n=1 Tax=Apteryx owenii TaxID=8824 RepID=A0A8B9S4L2_APTOW
MCPAVCVRQALSQLAAVTKQTGDHIVPVLVFGDKTDTKYVKVLSDFPALPAVTACAHLQWDTRTQEIATIFSYAVPAFINEFQLRGFVDEEGFVRFALIIHGHHSPYLPVFRADGHWHHFCVTWQQENGTWAIYADGKRRASASGLCAVGLSAPQAIYGQGTFIIGQDQDSLGGTFREKESFSGNITDLHIWQKIFYVCCMTSWPALQEQSQGPPEKKGCRIAQSLPHRLEWVSAATITHSFLIVA